MKKILVGITDDHELVRVGLRHFLSLFHDVHVILEACNGQHLLTQLTTTKLDVLLLDMTMPGANGADLITLIKTQYPELTILVLSMHYDAQVVLNAIRAGAAGYICKNSSPDTLVEAIRKVHSTGKYLSAEMAEELAYLLTHTNAPQLHQQLSDREWTVFRMIVEGKKINEIADKLCVSDKTISSHKNNLLQKLNLHSVADLVRYSIEHQLFQQHTRLWGGRRITDPERYQTTPIYYS